MKRTALAGVLSISLVGLAASSAQATELVPAFTWGKAEAIGVLQYGSDDLNFGLGARGGYTLPNGFYVGGMADYYFGRSDSILGNDIKTTFWDVGVEAGFDFAINPVIVLRPLVGLGILHGSTSGSVPELGQVSGSSSDALFELGGTGDYLLGNFLVGGDLRGLIVNNHSAVAVGVHGGWLFN